MTRSFIGANPGILFTRADKGNVTVAIEQTEYKQKMLNMLEDSNTYTVMNRDPTRKLTESVRMLLTKWKKCEYIDSKLYRKLYCSDGILPRKFGTPMGSPLSPIIADLVMEDLENYALERFGTEVPFYFRYVDDIVTAIPNHLINEFLKVFNSFHSRLQFTLEVGGNRTLRQTDKPKTDTSTSSWFTIPFLPCVYKKFKNIIKNLDVKLSFFSLNKMDGIIKAQKDVLPHESRKNVVYKINCKDCNASYVGQTSRKLKTRINEHKNDINRKNGNMSVISEHRLQFQHEFDWSNTEILDDERYYGKRMVSEMLNIKMQDNGLNLKSDTEFLHHAYTSIIDKF
ncbi:PREDICTED: uncharacterized protein LOC108760480 [Trachymyrmex cornetzi]|uniref:uncharacterized protein LOC108760480 n=1 Tax=Trachymyrmex cornetzi TaxID=471704 RepID=UPI00084F0DF5|nr:PREDICTED: uncharacterized protein LOC108760480 [Trachymyrmex cornetzi]